DDLWDRCTKLIIPSEVRVSTFCLEDLLIVLSLELIKDAARPPWLRLIKITDIAEILRKFDITNWHSLINRMRYVGLHRSVYFALIAADRLYGISFPPEIR